MANETQYITDPNMYDGMPLTYSTKGDPTEPGSKYAFTDNGQGGVQMYVVRSDNSISPNMVTTKEIASSLYGYTGYTPTPEQQSHYQGIQQEQIANAYTPEPGTQGTAPIQRPVSAVQPAESTPRDAYGNPIVTPQTSTRSSSSQDDDEGSGMTPEQEARYKELIAAGADPKIARDAVGLISDGDSSQDAMYQAEISELSQIPASTYTGPSIVDYLNSIKSPSDYASRARMAAAMGIQNYSGTAAQNTQMLNSLRKGQGTTAPKVTSTAPPSAPSSKVKADVLQKYNVKPPEPQQSPMLSFVDTYKQLLTQFGLPDIKKQFDKVQKEYDDLQSEKNDKIVEINDDPWLSEGVRVGRIKKLEEKYELKENTLTHKLKLYDSLYEQGIDEAQWVAGQAYDQYQFEQNQQIKLYELAQKQLDSQSGTADIEEYEYARAQGYKGSFVDYKKEGGGNAAKGTIFSGGLTYTPEDQSSDSQALNSSRGTDGYVDPTVYLNLYKAWIAAGGNLEDFLSLYPPKNYVNPANTWLPKYLMPKADSIEGQINSLF